MKWLCIGVIVVGLTVPGVWQCSRPYPRIRLLTTVCASADSKCLADQADTQPGFNL